MNTAVELPWLLENDRINRWYYRDEPKPGSIVMYTHDTYTDTVSHVTLTHVWLISGRSLLRPYIGRRLVRWSMNTIRAYRTRNRRRTYIHMTGSSASIA